MLELAQKNLVPAGIFSIREAADDLHVYPPVELAELTLDGFL
jgi:hypothetical protein